MSGCAGHWHSMGVGDHASPLLEPPAGILDEE